MNSVEFEDKTNARYGNQFPIFGLSFLFSRDGLLVTVAHSGLVSQPQSFNSTQPK
jgi:hypothetical protein